MGQHFAVNSILQWYYCFSAIIYIISVIEQTKIFKNAI